MKKYLTSLLFLSILIFPIRVHADYLSANSLQELFDSAKENSIIQLQPEEYRINKTIHLPKKRNVIIDATNTTFSGSGSFLSIDSSNLTWEGGTFYGNGDHTLNFELFHLKDSSFSNMVFNRAVSFKNHGFDLMGSNGITFNNIKSIGYGNTNDTDDLDAHAQFAEFIQTDYASKDASGRKDINDSILEAGATFDNTATKNVLVQNSEFLPYKEGNKIIAYSQSPIGQHTYGKNTQNQNIKFINNKVVDSIPMNSIDDGRYTAPIHFVSIKDLLIEKNTFSTSFKRRNWIQLANRGNITNINGKGNLRSENIEIDRNNFEGVKPVNSFIELHSNRKNPNYSIKNTKVSNNVFINPNSTEPKNFLKLIDTNSQIKKVNAYGNHGLESRVIKSYSTIVHTTNRADEIFKSSPYGTQGWKKIGKATDSKYANNNFRVVEEQVNNKSTFVKGTFDGINYLFIDKRAVTPYTAEKYEKNITIASTSELMNDLNNISISGETSVGDVYRVERMFSIDDKKYLQLYQQKKFKGYIEKENTEDLIAEPTNNKLVTTISPGYNIWGNFNWNNIKDNTSKYTNGILYEAKFKYTLGNNSTYYSLYKNNVWQGYLNTNAVKDVEPVNMEHSYVTATTDYPIWKNLYWTNKLGNTSNYSKGIVYKAKERIALGNGQSYIALVRGNTFKGYINEKAVKIMSPNTINQNIKITKNSYNIWKDFYWESISGKTSDSNFFNKTFLVKYSYTTGNGETYYSIYDSNDTWIGFLNKNATTLI